MWGSTVPIAFHEISSSGSSYLLEKIPGIGTDEGVQLLGRVRAECVLRRKDGATVTCQGELQAQVELLCDRCLTAFSHRIHTEVSALFRLVAVAAPEEHERQCSRADLDTVELETPALDLDDFFRQQLLLAIPVSRLCSEECRGLCPRCGCNNNRTTCNCAASASDSPFAVLGRLQRQP